MATRKRASLAEVARLLRQCLEQGSIVEIDGLGVFRPVGRGRYEFVAALQPQVFLAYAEEDFPAMQRLCNSLATRGFDPWLDKRKLLPGQNWPRSIERAIEICDFFIACLSRRSVGKRGCFQSELRYALDCASRLPLEAIYFIPVRLDDCPVPERIAELLQYADLFPDWDKGIDLIAAAMRRQLIKSGSNRRLRLAG